MSCKYIDIIFYYYLFKNSGNFNIWKQNKKLYLKKWLVEPSWFSDNDIIIITFHFTADYILYNCVCDKYKSWIINIMIIII